MSFRSIEITRPSEIHMKNGQMHIEQEEGEVTIPLEDIAVITCIGANIRISTMAMIQLAENGVVFQCIDQKYMPKAILMPCESNSRQSLVMNRQIELSEDREKELWRQIIIAKIENQSRVLSILGLEGAEHIGAYSLQVIRGDENNKEAIAAKEYFEYYHPGLNRRTDDPINHCLNYGYAVLRSAIIRSAITSGFLMSRGLFHRNQFNAFNLADDFIEPWRAVVDLIAIGVVTDSNHLSKTQRYQLANVLHHACMIDGKKTTVLAGIETMIDSIRKYVIDDSVNAIKLPIVLPLEEIGLITE